MNFPGLIVFTLFVTTPDWVQEYDAVAKHLRVDAEIFLAAEEKQHRIWNRTDPELQGGAVRNQCGHIFADLLFDITDLGRFQLDDRLFDFDDAGHLVQMDFRPAGPRHAAVHLAEHDSGAFGGRLRVVYREAVTAKAFFVRAA